MAVTAIYARLSKEKQDRGAAIERQLEDCHALAKRNGWGPVKEYIDRSISASKYSKKPRPEYDAMLAAAERGEIDRILTYHLDRLYRRPRELEPILDLAERGLIVADVEKGDLDLNTGDGRYTARSVVNGAAKASDDQSRRARRQKQQNREQGKQPGGRIPFGWTGQWEPPTHPGDKPTFMLEPLPAEVKALTDAMQRVVEGASLNDIAAEWSRLRLRARRWGGTDVRRVLTLPRHVALVPMGDDVVRDGEGNEVVAQWPAVVPRELWENCRNVLTARATGVGIPRRRTWLTGRLFCADCGVTMTRSNAGKRTVWRCWKGRGGCSKVSIGCAPLEDVILDEMFRYVDSAKLRAALSKRDDGSVAKVRRELDALRRRSAELVDAFADRGLTANAYRAAADRLDAQRRELDVQLGKLTEQSPLARFAKPGALRDAWPDLTVDEQRGIVGAVYPRIVIHPAKSRGCRFDASRVSFG